MKFHINILDGESINQQGSGCCYAMIDSVILDDGSEKAIRGCLGSEERIEEFCDIIGDDDLAEDIESLYAEVLCDELRGGDWDIEDQKDYAAWDRFSVYTVKQRFREAAKERGLRCVIHKDCYATITSI